VAIPGSKKSAYLYKVSTGKFKNNRGGAMNMLVIPGLIVAGFVIMTVIFGWICYKKFSYEK
jgi:hypothetical protein